MTIRYDKNGIRILDPQANNLRKECHPTMHVWESDTDDEYEHEASMADSKTTRVATCVICNAKDS